MISDEILHTDWVHEGSRLFGSDKNLWRFSCSKCGNVASPLDFTAVGAPAGKAVVECIGRWTKDKGCDWAAYSKAYTDRGRSVVMPDGSRVPTFDFATKRPGSYDTTLEEILRQAEDLVRPVKDPTGFTPEVSEELKPQIKPPPPNMVKPLPAHLRQQIRK